MSQCIDLKMTTAKHLKLAFSFGAANIFLNLNMQSPGKNNGKIKGMLHFCCRMKTYWSARDFSKVYLKFSQHCALVLPKGTNQSKAFRDLTFSFFFIFCVEKKTNIFVNHSSFSHSRGVFGLPPFVRFGDGYAASSTFELSLSSHILTESSTKVSQRVSRTFS